MRNIEQASRTSYAPRTYVQLETALQWPDGLTRKILDGTATRAEIDEVVDRGTVYAKGGGAAPRASAAGAQTIYPESIPSRAKVSEDATFTVGPPGLTYGPGERIPRQSPTIVTVTELLNRLGQQKNRTPAAENALQALHRLLPELWAENKQE
jgi:hypothetical protein